MSKVTYSPHFYEDKAEGHIFLGKDKKRAVTITLTGAASMSQEELNFFGEKFAEALNK